MALETKMLSFMKVTKDRMNNPALQAEIDAYVAGAKAIGATHCEIATVLGHINWVSSSKRWADTIHEAGMKVTWRCASIDMEGLYGVAKAVGPSRKSQQFYIDLARNTIITNPALFVDGDEWAIYPERTEGIWQDNTSWIWPNDPNTYANFFTAVHDTSKTAFDSIGKNVKVGLTADNASEFISRWMSKNVSTKYGYVAIDHYIDGNPANLESTIRAINTNYEKPIYLQESAVHRFQIPTAVEIKAYFDALKRMVNDGIITRFGYWGGWAGANESIFNADLSLNAVGLALKDFFAQPAVDQPMNLQLVLDAIKQTEVTIMAELYDLKTLIDNQSKLEQAEAIIWGSGTVSTKLSKLKVLIPNT